MAEAIALAASIIAILQIAGAATKLSKSLFETARKAGFARGEIENFAKDMNTFASIVQMAHDSIGGRLRDESDSAVLKYLQQHSTLGQLVDQATRVRMHIDALRPSVRKLRGKFQVYNQIKWVLSKKADVKALHPEMECVKSNLLVVMTVIQLELLQQRQQERQSDETRRQIKNLKRQIQGHIATISILREQQRVSTQQQYHPSAGSSFPFEKSSLIQLAESMVRTGEVPEPDIEYLSDDNSFSSPRWTMTSPESPESPESPGAPSNNQRGRSLNSQHGSTVSSGITTPSFNDTSDTFSEESTVITGRKRPHKSIHQEPLESELLTLEPLFSRPVEDGSNDYLPIHSGNSILRLNAGRNIQAEAGNIITPRNGIKAVTVVVDHGLEASIVSEKFVVENGLEIQDTKNEEVIVEFEPDLRAKSMGQVVLEWTKDFPHRKSVMICCWVVPYHGSAYFGKPFIDRMEYRWNQHRL